MARRNHHIVSFKAKDKRADKKSDKVDIFYSIIKSPVNVVDATSILRLPANIPGENLGFDIN